MSKLLVSVEDYYIERVTWMSQQAMKIMKDKFEELKLWEKARECPFKQFFEVHSL